jgi:hypothetical protein
MENKQKVEEAAEKERRKLILTPEGIVPNFIDGFIAGAKWQAERMYSEEDIARAFNEGMAYETMGKYIKGEEWVKTHKKEWFERVKKTNNGK